MPIDFDSIKDEFYELRDFILNDLDQLLGLRIGVNYTAALLISTACEALGKLRYESGTGAQFFKDYLIPKDWQSVAPTIFSGLRNGLAHSFATKAIVQIPGSPIELGISWQKAPHLIYDKDDGCLYLNIRNLAVALQEAFEKYEAELKSDNALRVRFKRKRKRKMTVDVHSDDERKAWDRLLSHNQSPQPTHDVHG